MSSKFHATRRRVLMAACASAAVGAAVMAPLATAGASDSAHRGVHTATPIKHLVVIFQENVSFDHYLMREG